MPNTPRMQWPYPSEGQDPWFDAVLSFLEAADASGYAGRENDNTILTGGGTVSFNAGTGVVSWTQAIDILAVYSGYKWTIPAGQLTLNDGQIAYVTLTRAPPTSINVTPVVANALPLNDNAIILVARNGSKVYFRNGASVSDGGSITPITGSEGSAASGVSTIDASLTTVDATVQTIALVSTIDDDAVHVLDLSFSAIDKSNNHIFERGVRVAVLKDETSTLFVRNVNIYSEYRDDLSWDTVIDTDGADDIRLRVQGDGTNPVNWNVTGTMKAHS